jgi:rhodanese-related sulfurtransferase
MRIVTIISAVFISFNLIACGGETSVGGQDQIAKNVNADEFHALYAEKGGQVLDVRTAEELQGGFIPNAVNIDFYETDFDKQLESLDKNKAVFVYCAAGGRSGQAMSKMKSLGFKEVYNLSGGFGTWAAAGYDVAK